MKKQIVILTALLLFGAQPAMNGHSWFSTVTNWFTKKPAFAISATALSVATLGWLLYKKMCNTKIIRKVDTEIQTEQTSLPRVDEVKRPGLRAGLSSSHVIQKATDILSGFEEIESLICEDVPGKQEAYKIGVEIKNKAEIVLADADVQQAIQTINDTTEAEYVRGTDKHYHFYQAVGTLVYAIKAHQASLD